MFGLSMSSGLLINLNILLPPLANRVELINFYSLKAYIERRKQNYFYVCMKLKFYQSDI